MSYRAVDRHNMMEGTALRDEELKIQTFVFQFLGLVHNVKRSQNEELLHNIMYNPIIPGASVL